MANNNPFADDYDPGLPAALVQRGANVPISGNPFGPARWSASDTAWERPSFAADPAISLGIAMFIRRCGMAKEVLRLEGVVRRSANNQIRREAGPRGVRGSPAAATRSSLAVAGWPRHLRQPRRFTRRASPLRVACSAPAGQRTTPTSSPKGCPGAVLRFDSPGLHWRCQHTAVGGGVHRQVKLGSVVTTDPCGPGRVQCNFWGGIDGRGDNTPRKPG
jgi:hypothetical protein